MAVLAVNPVVDVVPSSQHDAHGDRPNDQAGAGGEQCRPRETSASVADGENGSSERKRN